MSAEKILEKHSSIFNPLFADENVNRWKKDIIAAMEEYATAKAQASCEAKDTGAHSYTESAYKQFEKFYLNKSDQQTIASDRTEFVESSEPQEKLNLAIIGHGSPSETQEDLIKELILDTWDNLNYLGFASIGKIKEKFTITRNP